MSVMRAVGVGCLLAGAAFAVAQDEPGTLLMAAGAILVYGSVVFKGR